jgi:methionyl-tRNA formyltransferase
MKLLPEFGFIAAGTKRSFAYVEAMVRSGIGPHFTLLLDTNTPQTGLVAEALESAGIPFTRLETSDVNSPEVVAALEKSPSRIVLFSGPPGAIVRNPLFSTGRRFLHVHPGELPAYRGSTTIYYSLLDSGSACATALYLDEGIDTGPVLAIRSFEPPLDRSEIDQIYDPEIRASLLEDLLRQMAASIPLVERHQDPAVGQTHYIIHPVLKHIAILADGRRE